MKKGKERKEKIIVRKNIIAISITQKQFSNFNHFKNFTIILKFKLFTHTQKKEINRIISFNHYSFFSYYAKNR